MADESDDDDGEHRVYIDPAAFKSRSADTLAREDFTGDELVFTGYDLGAVRDGRMDNAAYGRPQRLPEDELYDDDLVRAKEKLRRARAKGMTNISLSVDEMAALERSTNTPSRDQFEPETLPKNNKSRGARSSSSTSLASTRPRRKSVGLPASTSPSQSRARPVKSSRKASNEYQAVSQPSSSTPPAFMIRGADGMPVYAPSDYYPSSGYSRQPSSSSARQLSSSSTRQVTPPYEAYPGRLYASELRPQASPSRRSPYQHGSRVPSNHSFSGAASYPEIFEESSSPSSQSRRVSGSAPDIAYAKLRRAPQGSPLSAMEGMDDRREWEARGGAIRQSSGSSSDDSGQGVRVEIEPGYGLKRVPVSGRSSGMVRRRAKSKV